MLRRSADLAAAQLIDPDGVDDHFAGVGDRFTIEQLQQTRFARARMTDEEDEFRLADLEIDVVERTGSVRIGQRHAAKFDHVLPSPK